MDYVYLLKNKITKRIYVGRSCMPQVRFEKHMSALRGNRHINDLMQLDFNEHGQESFELEIVEENENLTRKGIEGSWILKLRTYDKKYGYNYKDPFIWSNKGKFTQNFLKVKMETLLKESEV